MNLKALSCLAALTLIAGCTVADGSDAEGSEGTFESQATTAWSLSADQRRAFLNYYAPIIIKNAYESSASKYGIDWITNFDFDRDGNFATNKANWESVGSYAANPSAYPAWKVRPTLYSAVLEYMEPNGSKSLTLLYHVYHAKQEYSIHDWERVEIRLNNVLGNPGAGEAVRYVTVTEHSKHNVRVYPHGDLNFMKTAAGNHVMIWQAQWNFDLGTHMGELHFVENSWSTVNNSRSCSSCNASVDINGTSSKKAVHYVFVPGTDSAAVATWGAKAISASNALSLTSKRTSTTSWANVPRITYELQDLADILPTHADCTSCGGVACAREYNWSPASTHWTATPTVGIWLNEPVTSESGISLVPASATCSKPVTFLRNAIDSEDSGEDREGYPNKHWFWGAYKMGGDGLTSEAFAGTAFVDPSTGVASKRPCATGYNAYFCQHDYYAHSGQSGSTSNGTIYEYGRWLPSGWHLAANGGFDGRWTQLFPDNQ